MFAGEKDCYSNKTDLFLALNESKNAVSIDFLGIIQTVEGVDINMVHLNKTLEGVSIISNLIHSS